MATPFFPEMVSPLARSDAALWGTHIRRRNRKRSDGAVAIVRSVAAAMRLLLATRSSFDSLSVVVIVVSLGLFPRYCLSRLLT
jgi:hypothetical protein